MGSMRGSTKLNMMIPNYAKIKHAIESKHGDELSKHKRGLQKLAELRLCNKPTSQNSYAFSMFYETVTNRLHTVHKASILHFYITSWLTVWV